MVNELNVALEIFFFKNQAKDEVGRLVPDLFLFFKKTFTESKSKWLAPSF